MNSKDKARLEELEAEECLVDGVDIIDYFRLSCEKLREENEMLKKAIDILKPILDIYTGAGKAYIDCCFENPIITLDLYNDKDFKLYELLKEVLENDK